MIFNRRVRVSILSFALMSGICIPQIAYASTMDDLRTQIKDDKNKVEEIKKEIEIIETNLQTKTDELSELAKKIEDLEITKEQQYEDMKLRIQYMYENGDVDLVAALVTATDFSEVLNRTEMASEVYKYDREKLEQYISTMEELETSETELKKGINSLNTEKTKQISLQAELKASIADDEKELKKLEEEEARKKAAAASALKPTGNVIRNGGTYEYSQEDLNLIYAIVMQECNVSYEGALAVITCACNRAESSKWGYLGSDPLTQLTARGQFCYSIDTHWKKYLNGNASQMVKDAVTAGLNGARNHSYLSFRSYPTGNNSVSIGDNYYFSSM